ncbi:MAG: KpsF/GutQ family sugar-phosphate isomerase [bacterium]
MNIQAEIKKVIDIEINALSDIKKEVSREFEKAINAILNCRGKVIITGIGKSGIAAKKIASTMASTGTPAIFMHPSEAMHGDLGIVNSSDVVIAIGKSGESSELNTLLPFLKKIKVKIISITSNKNSPLARTSDIVINIGDIKEACPFNLAPTSSVTVSIVIGDAFAVVLMKLRNFKVEEFAFFHPGGRLGKRLNLLVSDIMLCGMENPVVNEYDNIHKMLMVITEKKAGAVSVIDKKSRLIGLVTDYDIRRILEKGKDIFKLKINDIMNKKPIFIYENEKAFTALEMMEKREKPITILPVINKKKIVVGMVRMHDLISIGL